MKWMKTLVREHGIMNMETLVSMENAHQRGVGE
jgi:hypothetical protein